MSEHINKLACGPRAMMIIAEKIGRPIDPDLLWNRFGAVADTAIKQNGAIYISTILDMARAFGIANHLDVTQDIERVGGALFDSTKVAGVLLITEWLPDSSEQGFSIARHVSVVHQIQPDKHGFYSVETESANRGEPSRVLVLHATLLIKMLPSYLVLVK